MNPKRTLRAFPARTNLRNVQGLLFEWADVLHDATAWRLWLFHLLTHLGLRSTYGVFSRLWDEQFLPEVNTGRLDHNAALRRFLLELGLAAGQIDEVLAASSAQRRKDDDSHCLLTGVRRTLARLHGVRLGILADAEECAPQFRRRLVRCGIDRPFQVVITSRDTATVKPQRQAYDNALAAMQLPASRVAFVASRASDLRGAARAGMSTIAVNNDCTTTADYQIDRFDQLLDLLPESRHLTRAA